MKIFLLLLSLSISGVAMASCPLAEMSSLSEKQSLVLYKNCAERQNDDASQAKLATIYDKGTASTARDLKKALFYYQLSADNGNAVSQARLAQLYMELDKNREGRADLYGYLESIMPVSEMPNVAEDNQADDFSGELVHPYVLLMLANEKAANKWYYPSTELEAPAFAKTLFHNYQIDDAKKQQLSRQATQWKKRKLLEMARQLLSDDEYRAFVEALYPAVGQADAFKRNQALKEFQEKVKQYKDK